MKEIFQRHIGKVAVLTLPHSDPLKGTVSAPHHDYVVLEIGEVDHFVAYAHIISVFFYPATHLTLHREAEEQASVV